MKIKFESLEYQNTAVDSICSLFNGQERSDSNFKIDPNHTFGTMFAEDGIGIANHMSIDKIALLHNLNKVQVSNQLPPSNSFIGTNTQFPQVNIEMETGTGKTFVYLKTIYELNKQYGFKKFIIVVPSVAIKEGVVKTFSNTQRYFKNQYNYTPCNLFMFNSKRMNEVRNFATDNSINVLVTTIQAFNKDTNLMNKPSDFLNGSKPIDLLAQTNPILIIDEPQSVDNTEKAINSINSLNPMIGLRFSATHKDNTYPKIFKLDAVEAYEKELVKQIEVASLEVNNYGNSAHFKLLNVKSAKTKVTAQAELYKKSKGGAVKKIVTLKSGDDLFEITGLQSYEDFGFIQDIDTTKGSEAVYFSGNPDCITLTASTDEDLIIKRGQISKTIEEHLNKELLFKKQNKKIKVLSLFFIDKVSNYRLYDENQAPLPGIYARIFEEEYKRLIKLPRYKELNDIKISANEVHDGYFSSDKKGIFQDTNGSTQADENTYELIMKNKEGLLTMYNNKKSDSKRAHKIRFIFSHSALKEGWDNPNIFQICTLVETTDTITKRQKIGRGLRIAVDQNGNRVPGFEINKLTIIANESYEEFAKGLQSEYEESGMKFGYLSKDAFTTITDKNSTADLPIIGTSASEKLFDFLVEKKYLDPNGKTTELLKAALENQSLLLPDEYKEFETDILNIIKRSTRNVVIKKAEEKVLVEVNPSSMLTEDFVALWNKIKYKSSYTVNFDTDKFLEEVINGTAFLDGLNSIETKKLDFSFKKSTLEINNSGIQTELIKDSKMTTTNKISYQVPDIISYLQNKTELTRKTIVKILSSLNNLDKFTNNPTSFMDQAVQIINNHKLQLIVNSLSYTKSQEYYNESLFLDHSMYAYLGENGNYHKVTQFNKTLFDYIVTDSKVELEFVRDLELNEEISFFIKLPNWFTIKTPLGPYNPDWAIVATSNDIQKLYFIIETKGTTNAAQLKPNEFGKILSGMKHFKALDTGVTFKKATQLKEIL